MWFKCLSIQYLFHSFSMNLFKTKFTRIIVSQSKNKFPKSTSAQATRNYSASTMWLKCLEPCLYKFWRKKCFILVSGNTLSWWILGTCCLYLVHHLINIVSFKEIKKSFDLIRFHFSTLCRGKRINAQSVSFYKCKTCLPNICLWC